MQGDRDSFSPFLCRVLGASTGYFPSALLPIKQLTQKGLNSSHEYGWCDLGVIFFP